MPGAASAPCSIEDSLQTPLFMLFILPLPPNCSLAELLPRLHAQGLYRAVVQVVRQAAGVLGRHRLQLLGLSGRGWVGSRPGQKQATHRGKLARRNRLRLPGLQMHQKDGSTGGRELRWVCSTSN